MASKKSEKTAPKSTPSKSIDAIDRDAELFIATARRQLFFWLMSSAGFLFFLWMFSDIMLPFVAGMALAYFLDPVADWLQKLGASRMIATLSILVVFILLFVVILVVLVPLLSSQTSAFLDRLPGYVTRLQALITSSDNDLIRRLMGEGRLSIQENLNEFMKEGATLLTTVLTRVWSSGMALINLLSLFVITPVVAFYLLYDWDRMIAKIDGWVPLDSRETVRTIAGDIDDVIAGFVRGQGAMCLILGFYYAMALTVSGLSFGLLIGLIAGLVSFIPFVGALVGFILSVGVALVQFWPDWVMIVVILGIFVVGQILEGYVLQPKLVGERVGLHPVWLMFALLAFASLLGFTGMLIAVPAAASIGVLVRFALGRYLKSPLYKGHTP